MASSEDQNVKINQVIQSDEVQSDSNLMNDERFVAIYEAICASELGSLLPPPLCREIAEFGRRSMDSAVLSNEEQGYLIEMIESQSQTEHLKDRDWKLLCRGSNGDDTQKAFHTACDGKEHTVCLLEVEETGWICGGYASTEWKSTNWNTPAKDDNAFLFVIRPKEKRNVFHRKKNEEFEGALCENEGILYNEGDGFNFGYNTLYWGNYAKSESQIRVIYNQTHQDYFTYDSRLDVTGHEEYPRPHWKDYEVFQLVEKE